MISAESISEILSVYKKHGWVLRRVLLSDALLKTLAPHLEGLFGEIKPSLSALEGLWFSRPSKGTLEAWELRHLSTSPYALVEVIDAEADEKTREDVFKDLELRMQNALNRKK
jgi:hypothetical protein